MNNQIQKCIFLVLNSKWELEEKCDKDWDKRWQIRPLSVSIRKHEKDILEDNMTKILTIELIINTQQKDKESIVQIFFLKKGAIAVIDGYMYVYIYIYI
jgi:hypothetical protein